MQYFANTYLIEPTLGYEQAEGVRFRLRIIRSAIKLLPISRRIYRRKSTSVSHRNYHSSFYLEIEEIIARIFHLPRVKILEVLDKNLAFSVKP